MFLFKKNNQVYEDITEEIFQRKKYAKFLLFPQNILLLEFQQLLTILWIVSKIFY